MCDIWRASGKSELTSLDIATILPELRKIGVQRVVLGGGEPLMHSDLWAICEPLRSAGIGITLLSTGILLARHASQVVRYCDDVVVSLDGPPVVHEAIRNIPNAFEKLHRGVAAIKDVSANVHVSGRCTVQRANFQSLRATVASAHAIGLDRMSFLAVDVSTDAFNRPGGWDVERSDQVALAREDVPLLEAELLGLERECAEDFVSGYIAENPTKLRARLLQYFRALVGEDVFPSVRCNAPWVSSVIESNGSVRPCYFHQPIGNLRTSGSLTAVLNSPSAVSWRRELNVGTNPICRRCVCSLALGKETSAVAD